MFIPRYSVLPVDDVEEAVRFYAALGCEPGPVDGRRWAELRSAHVDLSLCGPDDDLRPPVQALAFKVRDRAVALARVTSLGARLVEDGPRSSRLQDASGNHIVLLGAPARDGRSS